MPITVTLAYIVALAEEKKQEYADLWARMEMKDAFRHQLNQITIPPGYDKNAIPVHTPFVGDLLRRVKAILASNPPSIRELPVTVRDREMHETTRNEKAYNGLILRLMAENPMVWQNIFDSANIYGIAWHTLVWSPQLWPAHVFAQRDGETDRQYINRTRKEKRRLRLPVVWRDCDPRTIGDVWDDFGLSEIVEFGDRTVLEVHQRFLSQWDDGEREEALRSLPPYLPSEGTSKTVTVYNYYSPEEHVICTRDVELLRAPRNGRRPPYFRMYGLTTNSRKPAEVPVGIVDDILPTIEALERLLTMKENWAYMTAYPGGYLQREESEDALLDSNDKPVTELQIEPGKIKIIGSKKPEWMTPPATGKDLNDQIQLYIQLISDHSGIVPVLKGFGAADQPGYAIAQLLTAARQLFDPIRANAQASMAELIRELDEIIVHDLKTELVVWSSQGEWISRSPKDILDNFRPIEVNIEFVLPPSLIAMGQYGLQQVRAGAMSMRRHREDNLRIPNPDDEELEVLFELLKKDPMILEGIKAKVFVEGGMADVIARLKAMMEASAKDALAANSPPEQPNVDGTISGGPNLQAEAAASSGLTPLPPQVPGGMGPPPGLNGDGGMPQMPPIPAEQQGRGFRAPPMPGGRAAGAGIEPASTRSPGGAPFSGSQMGGA